MSSVQFTWPDPDPTLSHDSTWATTTEVTVDPEIRPAPGGWAEEERGQAAAQPDAATATFTISPNPAAVNDVVTVDASGSTAGSYPIQSYSWDFGDTGPAIEGETMTHTYVSAGTYTITLTVTDSMGGTTTSTDQITVT